MPAWEALPRIEGEAGALASSLHHDWLYQPLIPRLPSIRKNQFGGGDYPPEIIGELYVMVAFDLLQDEQVTEALTDIAKSCSEGEWRNLWGPLFKGKLTIATIPPVRTSLRDRRKRPEPFEDTSSIAEGKWLVEPLYSGRRAAVVFSGGSVLFFDEERGERYRDPELRECMIESDLDDQIVFGTIVGSGHFVADEIAPLEEGSSYETGVMRTILEDGFPETDRSSLVYAEEFQGTEGELLGLIYQLRDAGHHGVVLRSDAGCFSVG